MNSNPKLSALFLDSGGGWTSGGEESFILFRRHALSISSEGGRVKLTAPDGGFASDKDPLLLLEGYLGEGYSAAGYIGYEFLNFTEEGFVLSRRKEGDTLPDFYFRLFPPDEIIRGDISDLKRHLPSPPPEDRREGTSPESNMTKPEYLGMVERARDCIAAGEIYQANLSQMFRTPLPSHPLHYFLNLCRVQPTPFAAYLDFGEFQLISGSMELFLHRTGDKLTTKPIKGTCRRGATAEADASLKAELMRSEKERAENVMIVDLMRNDLSRICRYGTVNVRKLFDVESYSTLHQLVSEVQGTLTGGVSIGDIIRRTFPPGSVTGAPKRRAVQIIDELEPHRRGPYCGAIGIFSPDANFTLSVAIRILTAKNGVGTFWTGGGIVWDSEPESEYEETLLKAEAMRRAIGAE